MKRICTLCCGFLMMLAFTSHAEAISNKAIHWGFSKSKHHQPADAGKELNHLLNRYDAIYLGDTKEKAVYLTFDNGYENGYTQQILDVLKKQNVKATFFVTGHFVKDQPELVKRMAEEGHIVGNHSFHHPDLTTKSSDMIKEELDSVTEEVFKITGKQDNLYLRPPRGIFSERVLNETNKLGYQTVFWSAAFVDWKINKQKGWKYAYDHIIKQVHPGAIYLLHTVSKDNAEALDRAITKLKKEGYRFKSIDDLMFEKHMILKTL
ncbi:delta-lactam-biosynthetic de-N-acetylase [Bacillus sp. CLL-7-23]|uniref:Delta-lactam-biosynthetic de-N-acetylase n=1 Tax=Bacillus changyiensis TaxID=3004103 RepID=A0ABT4X313_9BACI|nr:delta-lactam-biosynthetic de-N-acetylase [Bacillus changyiensis]MDA7026688.1 delta-lactam-biosynthetic de-N-acetylase [Bacillus changyiensis]